MARLSPTLEGFRAGFRQPSLPLAEIAWRWSVGATTCTLLSFSFLEYLNTLSVSSGELLFLRSRQPVLISRAIAHILRGSLARVSMAALLGAAAVTLLWMFAASFGRAATVRALLTYFAERIAQIVAAPSKEFPPAETEARRSAFSVLLGLNILRAALTLGSLLALIGAGILAGFASPDSNPQPGLAFLLFLPLAGLVAILWSTLNWILSLAAVCAVCDKNQDTLGAISSAVALFRNRFGPLTAVSFWFGLAHVAVLMGASTAASFSLGFLGVVPGRMLLVFLALLSILYFAVVDWLYMARLAGYVCIAEMPDALFAPTPLPTPPPRGQQPGRGVPLATSIDRNEPILSDVPGLAVET